MLGLLMELLPFSTCLWGDACGLVSKGRNWPGVSGQVTHFTRVELCFFSAVSMGAQFGVASLLCVPGFSFEKKKKKNKNKKKKTSRLGTSLVVQRSSSLGDSVLPRQRAWVQFLIKELDPTCHS